jgi:hypothetical protein
MIWAAQRKRVERLSVLARRNAGEIAAHRRAMRAWRRRRFGTLDALAWSFAAGALWAAVPADNAGKSRARRFIVAAANLAWLTWHRR